MSRRFRLKPAGYIVLGILVLVVILCVYLIIRALTGSGSEAQPPIPDIPEETQTAEISPEPEDTPDPGEIITGDDTFGQETEPEEIIPEDIEEDPQDEKPDAEVATITPPPEVKTPPTPTASPRTPTSSEKKNAKYGTLKNDGVNLRSGPSTGYPKLKSYNKGATMMVYATDGDFYFVKMDKDGKVGFMAKKYVTTSTAAQVTIPPEVPEDAVGGKVSASTVALRSGPNKTDSAIKELKRGTVLYVYYKIGDFYYVEVAETGKKGFAYASYVSVDGDVPKK